MKVTDEMCKVGGIAYLKAASDYLVAQDVSSPKAWEDFTTQEQEDLKSFIKVGLEAVFDHIEDKREKVEPEEKPTKRKQTLLEFMKQKQAEGYFKDIHLLNQYQMTEYYSQYLEQSEG